MEETKSKRTYRLMKIVLEIHGNPDHRHHWLTISDEVEEANLKFGGNSKHLALIK